MSERLLENETIQVEPGIRVLPIVHGSVEYSVFLRRLFLQSPPALLAVELPENMSQSLARALPHADAIPVLSMESKETGLETHFILEPLEPLVEAVRSAYETGTPYHLVDSYNDRYMAWVTERFPDTYSVGVTGPARMYQLYEAHRHSSSDEDLSPEVAFMIQQADFFREVHMARELRTLKKFHAAEDGEILLVCGVRHVDGIRNYLAMDDEEFESHATLLRAAETFPGDDMEEMDEEPLESLLSREERIGREDSDESEVVYRITTLARNGTEVLEQPGYYNAAWLQARRIPAAVQYFSRILLQRSAYKDAVDTYEKRSGDTIPLQREKLFFRFARNWSYLEGKLLPDMYRLVMSARGFGNDQFARTMYDTLSYLPDASGSPFPERKLTLDDLYKNSKLLRFRFKGKIKRPVPPPNIQRRFTREKYPGEWIESWRNDGICSFPPEDLQIEGFGTILREKADSVMKGKESKTVEFTSSLLDGIDYRETIRNYHLGKVFVQDTTLRGLNAGAVVILFSNDDVQHSWKVVWWGEHHQESDMAFYSTPPGEVMAGPGIFQCRYGGLMMTLPPGRLHNIWEDPQYDSLESSAERLIVAAMEYNNKSAIVHLADRPPSQRMHALAGRMGQRIVHIPLSTMDQVTLSRIRRFHVLDSKERRGEAEDYID